MTFDQVTTEICSRVNDPEKDTYGERAEKYFEQAVNELAVHEDTRLEEIQGLVVDLEAFGGEPVTFSGGEASFDIPYGTLRVLDVYLEPADLVNTDLILKEVTHDEIKRTKLEPAFLPAGNECFWYRVGNVIRFLLSSEWEGEDVLRFTFQAIISPDNSEWADYDLTNEFGYGNGFVFRCIDNAAARITGEIAGQ